VVISVAAVGERCGATLWNSRGLFRLTGSNKFDLNFPLD